MSIRDEIYKRIKEEITLDPMGVGYAGKSDQEILNLLNAQVVKQEVVDRVSPQPMLRIIDAIAYGPNGLTLSDVTEAKKAVID